MASGKTVVGRRLASRLGWKHIDLDREIEKRTGRSIAEIFASEGEAGFRSLEVQATPYFQTLQRVVLSPGGGWITNPGLIESLPPNTLTVWLKVSPAEVVRRLTAGSGAANRPLLQGDDPLGRARELLAQRDPLYQQAQVTIETEGRSVDQIVHELTRIVNSGTTDPEGTHNPQHGS